MPIEHEGGPKPSPDASKKNPEMQKRLLEAKLTQEFDHVGHLISHIGSTSPEEKGLPSPEQTVETFDGGDWVELSARNYPLLEGYGNGDIYYYSTFDTHPDYPEGRSITINLHMDDKTMPAIADRDTTGELDVSGIGTHYYFRPTGITKEVILPSDIEDDREATYQEDPLKTVPSDVTSADIELLGFVFESLTEKLEKRLAEE